MAKLMDSDACSTLIGVGVVAPATLVMTVSVGACEVTVGWSATAPVAVPPAFVTARVC